MFHSRKTGKVKLHDGPKYLISEALVHGNGYTWQMNLTVRNLQKSDFGAYTCISVNALGKQDARIRLQGTLLLIKYTTHYCAINSIIIINWLNGAGWGLQEASWLAGCTGAAIVRKLSLSRGYGVLIS